MDPTPIVERQYETKRSCQRENPFERWRQIFLESSSCEIVDHLGYRILGRSFTLVENNKVIGSNCIWIHQVPSNPLVSFQNSLSQPTLSCEFFIFSKIFVISSYGFIWTHTNVSYNRFGEMIFKQVVGWLMKSKLCKFCC